MSPMYQLTGFLLLAGAYFALFAVLYGASEDPDLEPEVRS